MVKLQRDELSHTFHALADPTRRRMLARLARGDATVGALANGSDLSLPAISKHLKVLEAAGLVRRMRIGSKHIIQLRERGLDGARTWLGDAPSSTAGEQLARLASLLEND